MTEGAPAARVLARHPQWAYTAHHHFVGTLSPHTGSRVLLAALVSNFSIDVGLQIPKHGSQESWVRLHLLGWSKVSGRGV